MALRRPRGPLVAFWLAFALVLAGGIAVAVRERPGGAQGASAVAGASGTSVRADACAFDPLLPATAPSDGQAQLPTDPAIQTAADAAGLVWLGQEAAGQGRMRDAEVSFIAACRVAAQADGPAADTVAQAKYQLGRHYLGLASRTGAGAITDAGLRGDLLRRAQAVLYESRLAFLERHGEGHAQTRMAAVSAAQARQELAALQGSKATAGTAGTAAPLPPPVVAPEPATASKPATAPAAPPTVTAAPAPAPAARTQPPPSLAAQRPAVAAAPAAEAAPAPRKQAAPAVVTAASPAARTPATPAATTRPSFNCAKARSVPEKMICADPELARLDRELGGLHARAKRAAPDTAAFNRRNEREWKRREANCRDRMCLFAWYAERRQQLEEELERSQPRATAAR